MSDHIKHECGIALIRLLKTLEYYQKKYGTKSYGVNKMYLMMEKQHNRGQDGAGLATVKINAKPGEKYIFRERSSAKQPIQEIFSRISERIQASDSNQNNTPFQGELLLGHVRYGTFGKNNIESVHPFLRQNNWTHRNLIVAGNFNMTNNDELFENLVKLGQHPKSKVDSVTVMEKIGHFLDDAVHKIYRDLKKEGYNKQEASPLIEKRLKISKILRKASKDWDGGYAMAGLLGHGDAFVLRDPSAIRPAYFFKNDEVAVVASERPVIQTVFNTKYEDIQELEAGHSIIIKKSGKVSTIPILEQRERKACSFERIYFSRGNDADIYAERKKLGKLFMPKVLEEIKYDSKNTVFSYIPNTAETSFFGMADSIEEFLNQRKTEAIIKNKNLSEEKIIDILSERPRIEKIAVKDVKLRTFITEDNSRDDLVEHVYDVTYGVIKPKDSLVIIDDSIVRGTTLKKSILKMLDRLSPVKIVVVSSAPQVRYPDCYGIDMANLDSLIAFKATLELLKDNGKSELLKEIYAKCKEQVNLTDKEIKNYVKDIYNMFTADQISDKIGEILSVHVKNAKVKIIYQSIENLHEACPSHTGDWYFTGDYPTPGGNRVVNNAFINFYEGNKKRAY